MSEWAEEAVFCHNDLTPRNLIITSYLDQFGATRYKLAGIIDWELSGFYPASCELSLQDSSLSLANRHISFYLLLKEQLAKLVPRTPSQISLLSAMELIYESQQRLLLEGFNLPAHIRRNFWEVGGLVKNSNIYRGWMRRDGCKVEFDEASYQKLVDDVIEEMSANRRAAASR